MSAPTVNDLFSQLGLVKWWNAPDTNPFNPGAGEWGTDFATAPNTPIGSITDGRVVYVGPDPNHPQSSIGQIVQVEAPDGSLLHYQHLRGASVKQGDTVTAGQVIGLSGGCPANGYAVGGGCSFTDAWSTGPHIEVRYSPSYNAQAGFWYQGWTDSLGPVRSLVSQPASSSATVSGVSGALGTPLTASPSAQQSGNAINIGAGQWQWTCRHSLTLFPGATFCADAAVDFGGRTALALAGAGLLAFALLTFLAGHEDLRSQVGQHLKVLGAFKAGVAEA